MDSYAYRGARALVLLHDQHLRTFLALWQEARASAAADQADDAAALDAMLHHVLGAAAGYMRWICEVLELPDPAIEPTPEAAALRTEAEAYAEHVLQRWQGPLESVAPERFEDRTYAARWGTPFTIDGMLEHAVMHPIRHHFQLETWLASRTGS